MRRSRVVASSSPAEVELKFLFSVKSLAVIAGNPICARGTTQEELRSVYFDTSHWDLRRKGVSLRVRCKRGAFIQTVKREAGVALLDRGEWETSVAGDQPSAAGLVGTPAEHILQKHGAVLVPVFTTIVQRTSRTLKRGEDRVEISLDHGEITAKDLRDPIDELELELKGGSASGLFLVARGLMKDTILLLSFESKAERGYRLLAGQGLVARKAEPIHIRAQMTGGEAFQQVARNCLTQVCANANLLRESREPEVVHQLRVGLRRLRAAFTTFKAILPGKALDQMNAEMRWIGSELDPARDIDVFIEGAAGSAKADNEVEPLQSLFGERLYAVRTERYGRAIEAVESKRFAVLLLTCAEWVETGRWRRSENTGVVKLRDGDARVLAGEALERLSHQLRKATRRLGTLDPVARHRARIKAKKLRYAGEFFDETFGKHMKARRSKFIASLTELQDALGGLNDMTAARATALAAAGDRVELAFLAGRMIRARERDERDLLANALRSCDRWRDAKPFWR